MKKVFMLVMVLCLAIGGMTHGAIEDGLLGYWPLDGDGTDASINGRHGVVLPGSAWEAGKLGDCLRCDGKVVDAGGVVEGTAVDWANGLDGFTISVWIKSDETNTDKGFITFQMPTGNDDRDMRYDRRGASSGGTVDIIKMGMTVTDTAADNGVLQLETSANSQVLVWQHVVMTWSSGSSLTAYIDGVENVPAANRAPKGGVTKDNLLLIIGKGGKDRGNEGSSNGTGNRHGWDGLIDEVAIWNRALSADEVAQVYNGGQPKAISNPACHAVLVAPAPDGVTGVAEDSVVLEWDPGAEDPGIVEYDVYLTTDPATLADPNDKGDALIATVPVADPRQVALATLLPATTYLWQIESVTADGNSCAGPVWSFTTVIMWPIILQQPVSETLGLGCVSEFTVIAQSGENSDGGVLTYQWYDASDDSALAGETGATLATGTEGDYYVIVTNDNGSVQSDTVSLVIIPDGIQPDNMTVGDEATLPGEGFTSATGVYTVGGAGHDIWDSYDDFQFVYIPMSGDGEISARVVSVDNTGDGDSWMKACVMVRNTLSDASLHASMAATTGNGVAWQGRRAVAPSNDVFNTGGLEGGGNPTPVWIKVVRVGSVLTGYSSQDGVTWTQRGTETMAGMVDPLYIGLAVTSHTSGFVATAVYDNVSAVFGGETGFGASWAPVNPSPASGSIIDDTVDLDITWEQAELAPCGAIYEVFVSKSPISESDCNDLTPTATTGTPSYTVLAADIDHEDTIYVRVAVTYDGRSQCGALWSYDASSGDPVITGQPADTTALEGDNASFTVEVTGEDSLQWSGPAGEIAGETGATLTLTDVSGADEGDYFCVATNASGSTQSDIASLNVGELIGHWPLDVIIPAPNPGDPNSKALTPDATAFDHDGAITGEPNLVPGVIGNALGFNGVDEFVEMGPIGISGNQPRSIIGWVKVNTVTDDHTGVFGFSDSGARPTSYDFHARTNGNIDHHVGGYRDDTIDHWDEPAGSWHLYAMTYDGTGGGGSRRYYDGVLDGTSGETLATEDFFYMVMRKYEPTHFLDGALDDVRVYDYALSALEVALIYLEVFPDAEICIDPPDGDLDGDCVVTLNDFAIWALFYGWCDLMPDTDCPF